MQILSCEGRGEACLVADGGACKVHKSRALAVALSRQCDQGLQRRVHCGGLAAGKLAPHPRGIRIGLATATGNRLGMLLGAAMMKFLL